MYYFAYGSNMSLEQMRRLCGWHFQVLGAAVLKDFEFGPDVRGYTTIHEKAGAKVFGVLYEVDQHCIDALDMFEGVPNVFKRIQVQAGDLAGKMHEAWAYSEPEENFGGDFVKQDFLNRIITAAEEHHLPKDWIKFLDGFKKA